MLPIEDTSEAGGFYYLSGTATALNPVTTYPSARRGHGGTITNIRIDDVYDNSRSGVRFGQQVNTSGTWLAENIIDQVSVCASGTIYAQMANENTTLWHVAFPVWNVVSGTTGVAGINLGNNYVPGFSDYEIGEVRQDTGVWVNPIYGESSIGGAYGAEIRNLRQGCVATWTFATDTSGSNAYDWTGNGYNLANNNGVTFTSGTIFGTNAATFNGSSSQSLTLSGTGCPNLAAMKEWTIWGWINYASSESGGPPAFVLMDGTTPQFWVGEFNGSGLYCYSFKTTNALSAAASMTGLPDANFGPGILSSGASERGHRMGNSCCSAWGRMGWNMEAGGAAWAL